VRRTTGEWLYEQQIFPHPNVKGSLFDLRSQHDCYPFIVYNIFTFWFASLLYSWETFEVRVAQLFLEKCQLSARWLYEAMDGVLEAQKLFESVR
jgi:hypothetical protein